MDKVIYPFGEIPFIEKWIEWLDYRRETHKFRYKTAKSEQTAVNRLHGLAGGDYIKAIEIIDTSISNQWKGLFKLQDNGKRSRTIKPEYSAAARQYGSLDSLGQELFGKIARLDSEREDDTGNP